jgi:PKD repeat protein
MNYYREPDFDLIKNTIYNHGPVATYMLVYEDFNYYRSGIYRHDPNSDIIGGHAIIIVGYYDEDQQYLICKNSWGQSWGENGYFRIPHGESMLGNQIYYVTVDNDELNFPPIADAGSNYAADTGEPIQFSSENCFDQDDNIISYHWDFGDGTTSTEENPSHTYQVKGIYPVTLTIVDALGLHDIDEITAYIDLWTIGDTWMYDFRFKTIPDALYPPIRLPMELKITDFTMTVTGETKDEYLVDLSGNLKGNMSFVFERENKLLNFRVWGKINRGIITGTIHFSKNGLGINHYEIDINGFSQLLSLPIIPIPLYVPLPFTIQIEQEFDSSKSLIGITPEIGKYWVTPASQSSMSILFSSMFGFISKSFENPTIINEPVLISVTDYTPVLTKHGNYQCYQLTAESSSQLIQYYFSNDLYNIVKIDIQDPELFSLIGELKTSTYT